MAKENCDLTLRITEISIYTCVCVRVCVCVCVCDWHTLKIKLPNSTNEITSRQIFYSRGHCG
jgi:hypothetical protein